MPLVTPPPPPPRFTQAATRACLLTHLLTYSRTHVLTYSLFSPGREAYRIVNDRDIVARLPRSGTVAGAVLDYEHVGKTVLVAETAKEADGFAGFWAARHAENRRL